jgi:hypothetical protein
MRAIKKISVFLSLGFLIFGLSSCKKLDELTKFDIKFNQEFTIQSGGNLNLPFDILTPDMTTNSEYEFELNDTRKDLVNEIKLKEMVLTIKSPESSDFSFLKSVSVFIKAEGLSELKLAWKESISDDIGNQLVMDVSSEDFKEYIKKDKFSIRVNTTTDKVIKNDHVIDIYSVYRVDAKRKDK